MNDSKSLSFDSSLEEYERRAEALFEALNAGGEEAAWRFKWEHPRFAGRPVSEVRETGLDPDDARTVVAREYGFKGWAELREFTVAVGVDGPVRRFETAVEAVVCGDLDTLATLVAADPGLPRERSIRRHHATLLHYVAANGVEGFRQRTPGNAVAVARFLLESGAEVDALADMYGAKCTTLSMLLSSSHPAEAGLQAPLAETLLDFGASLDGSGTKWRSALMTALCFGYLETAQRLAARGARPESLEAAAGLGLVEECARRIRGADPDSRHAALALAAQHGHEEVVRLLLDHGEDPSRYNPEGFHAHTTPLHQAVWADHLAVVRLLVERGARVDVPDTIYGATPRDWAFHGGRHEIAGYLERITSGS